MTTRLVIKGRLKFTNDRIRYVPVTLVERDEMGDQVFYGPVSDEDVTWPQPLDGGELYRDPETKLRFRLVDRAVLRIDQGWASAEYWLRELRCPPSVLYAVVRAGHFDCAAAPPTLRYRCLDYVTAMDRVRKLQKTPRLRGRNER